MACRSTHFFGFCGYVIGTISFIKSLQCLIIDFICDGDIKIVVVINVLWNMLTY